MNDGCGGKTVTPPLARWAMAARAGAKCGFVTDTEIADADRLLTVINAVGVGIKNAALIAAVACLVALMDGLKCGAVTLTVTLDVARATTVSAGLKTGDVTFTLRWAVAFCAAALTAGLKRR